MIDNQYFETIKCEDFEVFNLTYHKKRVANTICKNLSLEEYITPPNKQLLRCKIIYTQDEIIDIQYYPYIKRDIKSLKLIYDNDINYRYKSTNRTQIDNLLTKKDNCDDILIIKNGLVTDTSIANIAILYNNTWLTPKIPLLYGTTRDKYIQDGILKEYDISVDMLKNSTKIALLNAMIGFDILNDVEII